jgi:hypothetical protein
LGVLLYELLVGALPFDPKKLREGGLETLQRLIREEDPPTPSTRIKTMGKEATALAERRDTVPGRLEREVRRELDWITMRAMEKDRTRRYATALALGEDVERYLRGEPVEAGPPTLSYRVRKYAKKRRSVVVAVAMGLLVVGVVGALGSWQRAKEQAMYRQLDSVLEMAVATGGAPELIDPNWDALLPVLWDRVREERDYSFTILAERAAVGAKCDFPVWGGAGGKTWFLIEYNIYFYPGVDFECRVRIENTVDNGEWSELDTRLLKIDESSKGRYRYKGDFDELPLYAEHSAGSHEVNFRAIFSFFDPKAVEGDGGVLRIEDRDETRRLRRGLTRVGTPLFTETRPLGKTQLEVFDQVPDDYPEEYHLQGDDPPIESWFQIDSIKDRLCEDRRRFVGRSKSCRARDADSIVRDSDRSVRRSWSGTGSRPSSIEQRCGRRVA